MSLMVAFLTAASLPMAARAQDGQNREDDLTAIRVTAINEALRMGHPWGGAVAYVSVGLREDPSSELLKALADGEHEFKRASACPQRRYPEGLGPAMAGACQPEKGAIELFVGEVRVLAENLAEATLGYRFGPLNGVCCRHRFRRTGHAWALVEDYIGECSVC
jgi:hypothetical protein